MKEVGKAVLISIRPEWVEKIVTGEKTLELRKNRPKLNPPFKCYIYCTKGKDVLVQIIKDGDEMYGEIYRGKPIFVKAFKSSYAVSHRGRIIGEFVCDVILPMSVSCSEPHHPMLDKNAMPLLYMTDRQIIGYLGNGKLGYAWHISDLVVYDKPLELSKFCSPPEMYCEKERCGGCPKDQVMGLDGDYAFDCEWKRPILRPPQSWCYVEPRHTAQGGAETHVDTLISNLPYGV